MFNHEHLYGKTAYLAAREIDRADLPVDLKVETALKVGLPILDPAVAPIVKRWITRADQLEIASSAIEETRQMLELNGAGKHRARKAKASPILERPLWDKLSSED